jgi:anti-sigma factor RsiW
MQANQRPAVYVEHIAMRSDSASAATSRPPHVGRLLGAYVLESADPVEADVIRGHLAWCELCAEEHAALVELVRLLRAHEGVEDER